MLLVETLNDFKNEKGFEQDLLTPGFLKEWQVSELLGHICHKTKHGADVCIALGKTGLVQGNIFGVRVLVAGRVEGNVHASERVELHSGADVHGDIVYAQIGIEHGARLSGKLSKIADKNASPENDLENS